MVSGTQPNQLQFAVAAAIRQASHPQIRSVTCEYRDGQMQLRGRVASYYLKQLAQSIAGREVREAVPIDNRLEVVPR